mgnify:CR=1 FL=1
MAKWLFKSEPSTWSWMDQVAKGKQGEGWDGVRNYQANNNMKKMKIGDFGFFYHSGFWGRVGRFLNFSNPNGLPYVWRMERLVGEADAVSVSNRFLQKKFETTDSDFKVEVINAGSSGAYSKTETLYVKHKLLDFDPDLIIVYDGWNDSRIPYTSHIGERGLAGQLYDSVNHLQSIFPYYKTPIVIREIGRDLISAEEDTIATRIDANLDKKVILWKERWNESCLLAQKNDIKTLITIQPMLGTGDRIVTKSEKSTSGLLQNDFMQLPLYQLQKFVDVLPELTNCTNTADLTHVFDGHNEPIFLDLGHVGEQGSMLISEKIYELVLPIINTE